MPTIGMLKKMQVVYGSPVQYSVVLGQEAVSLNELLGQSIALKFLGTINCVHCQRSISKTYNQGYCYSCFISLAQCDMCIMKPELCHYAKGTCREPAWGLSHCMTKHYVYLSNTSSIKVGITRAANVPGRWIDQGATQATLMYEVKTRHQAGLIEVILAKHIGDKTNWRAMLKGDAEPVDLMQLKLKLHDLIATELVELEILQGKDFYKFMSQEPMLELEYPVLAYPSKIATHNLEKDPLVQGVLLGIKGQYLMLDDKVINLRKYSGYTITIG